LILGPTHDSRATRTDAARSRPREGNRSTPWLVLLACAALVLMVSAPASALELGEWVPGLRLSPFFTERIEYESNVFQVPSHSQGSVIIREIPGFLAEYTFGPHSLSASARADILNYLSLPSQNTINYAGLTDLRLEFPRLLVGIRDDVVRTTEPPNTELTGPIVSLTNTFASHAQYRLTNRLAAGAAFSWLRPFYPDQAVGRDLNRNEYLGTGSVFWKVTPKTALGLNANFDRKIFTDSPDRDVTDYGMTLSLQGDLTAKLSSTFRIGFLDRVPDTSSQPGFFGLVMGGGLSFRPTARTTIALLVDRSPQESTFNNVPFFTALSAALSVSQQITPKINVTAKAGGGVNNYPEKQETVSGQFDWRQDTFYSYGLTANYAIQRWLNVGLSYERIARNSNFDQYNFVDDRVSLLVTLQF
jgi:hypothetical protein